MLKQISAKKKETKFHQCFQSCVKIVKAALDCSTVRLLSGRTT